MFKKLAATALGGCLLVAVLCLGLLPVTALAAAPSGQELYVGGVQLSSTGYWTTGSDGTVTSAGNTQPVDNYIHYDADTNTLTLHNATIKKELAYDQNTPAGSTIPGSAIGVLNQSGDAELTVQLEGSNTIDGVSTGICVHSSGGGAALSITGNGTLVIDSTFGPIRVIGFNANAALSIENAKVTATSSYGFGVTVQSGNSENSSASLTVDGGSLTATAPSNNVSGILFVFGSGGSGSGTPNLTVSGNATVRANGSAGGITSNSSTGVHYGTGSNSTGGIVWNGKDGTVYGKVELQENLEIGEGESLTIEDGASLNTGSHEVIVNGGTLTGGERITGTVKYAPTITTQPTSQTVTEGGTATFTVVTSGTEPLSYQWQQSTDSGQSWTNIVGATDATYTTEATTTSMNGYQYRCVASNSAGSATSDAATLTVHVHAWGEPVWSWSEDGKTATATFTCKNDGSHQATEDAAVTSAVKTPATCTEAGVTTYTATVEFNGKTYTSTKDVTDIPATGHEFEGGLCSVCGARDTSFSPALVSGDGSKWTKGSSKGLTFVSSAAFADLVEVRLDGRVLSASEYAVREGSTVVTLPAKLLEGLKAGDHELLIVSGSGTVRASLTVAEAAKVEEAAKAEKASADELPASGDSTAPALAVAAAAAAGAGLVLLSRRRAAR